MRVVAAQTFCCGQLAPEAAQAGQHLIRTSQTTDSDPTVVLDQVDLITLLETKLSDEYLSWSRVVRQPISSFAQQGVRKDDDTPHDGGNGDFFGLSGF